MNEATDRRDARPAWQIRRERVDESARAILAVLEAHRGEWVPVWRTLLDAQLRGPDGLVDVALSESIGAIQHRLGVPVERSERMPDGGFGTGRSYRVAASDEDGTA